MHKREYITIKWLLMTLLAVMLAACGSGGAGISVGGSSGGSSNGSGSGSTGGTGSSATTSSYTVSENLVSSTLQTLNIAGTNLTSTYSELDATVQDGSGKAVPNAKVVFGLDSTGSTLATLSAAAPTSSTTTTTTASTLTALTDSTGKATVFVVVIANSASTSTNSGNVSATYVDPNNLQVTASKPFVVGPPPASTSKLTLSLSNVSLTVGSSSSVTALVVDSASVPVVNANVTFALSAAGASFGQLSSTSATTDSTGKATVQLKGLALGGGAITATYVDSQLKPASNTAGFNVVTGYNILLTAAQTSILSGTGSKSTDTITATVTDQYGGAVSGQAVQFSVGSSNQGTFTGPSLQTTDVNGHASVNFAASSINRLNQTASVNASTTSSTNGSVAQANVTFQIAGASIALSAPKTNLKANDSTTVTAVLADGNGSVIPAQTLLFTTTFITINPDSSQTKTSSTQTAITDSTGSAQITVTVPATSTANQIQVSATTTAATTTAATTTAVTTVSGTASSQILNFSVTTSNLSISPSGSNISVTGNCTAAPGATNSVAPHGFPSACTAPPTNAQTITATYTTTTGSVAGSVLLTATMGDFFVLNTTTGKYIPQPYVTVPLTVTSSTTSTATAVFASQYAGASTITGVATLQSGNTVQAAVSDTFVAGTPAYVSVQAAQSVLAAGQQSQVTAIVRDANDNPVANAPVVFNLLANDSNSTLSGSTGTTDQNGQASVTFTAGSAAGGSSGVTVQASISGSSVSPAVSSITVGGTAMTIGIGSSNVIVDVGDNLTYDAPLSVIVTDASGRPVPNVVVNLSVYPVQYYKGVWVQVSGSNGSLWVTAASSVLTSGGGTNTIATPPQACSNEDLNLNGVLDPTENNDSGLPFAASSYPGIGDVEDNGNGRLEPGNPVTLSSANVTTNSKGIATFDAFYPKRYAEWVNMKLVASTLVGGTESVNSMLFIPGVTTPDAKNQTTPPSGQINGPFGVVQSCTNPN